MGAIIAYPSQVHADASVLLVYQGQPNRSLSWSLSGSGIITPFSNNTDAQGRAGAKYTPGTPGNTVTVEVIAGA